MDERKAEEPKLLSHHFDCGNSTDGAIGFCARIKAKDKAEALEILKRVLPEEIKIRPCGENDEDNDRVEYIEAYLSPRNITADDIDEADEEE